MKTNLFYIALALSLLFTACKKDKTSTGVVGVWEITSVTSSNCDDPSSNATLSYEDGCFEFLGLAKTCQEWEFKSDNTYEYRTTATIFGVPEVEIEKGTYTIDGDAISATGEDGTEFDFTYSSSGPTLTGNFHDEEEGCDVQFTFKKK